MKFNLNRVIFLSLALFSVGFNGFSAPFFVFKDSLKTSLVHTSISIFKDSSNQLTLEQVIGQKFTVINEQIPNLGVSKATFWLKFKVVNQIGCSNLTVHIKQPQLQAVQLWYFSSLTPNGYTEAHLDRSHIPFRFNVHTLQNDTLEIISKIQGNAQLYLPIEISASQLSNDSATTTEMLYGLYAGLLLAMVVYNLFIYFTVRDSSYLFYVGYILFICFNQLTLVGFLKKYLWADFPWWESQSVTISSCMSSIMAIFFVMAFLQVKKYHKGYEKVLWGILVMFMITMGISMGGFTHASFQIMQIITLVGSLFLLYVGFYILIKGYRPARFFMLAWSVLLIGVIIFILKDFAILPYNVFTSNTVQYASGIEVVLLSFALGDKINILEKEKQASEAEAYRALEENDRIIKNQNVLLEIKVSERTEELRAANEEVTKTLKDLKDAQAQLVNAEKMASLGQMTAGIAHEINNPINFVVSSVTPLKRDLEFLQQIITSAENLLSEEDKALRIQKMKELLQDLDYEYLLEEMALLLKGIEEGSVRTHEIVRSLRNFSRLDEGDYKKANLAEGIQSTLLLLNSALTDGRITLVKEIEEIPAIDCQPGKLNQVFMNILNNAIYAVKNKENKTEQPTITVKVFREELAIKIIIGDNGMGMSPKTKEKLFEPFFTTKDVGEGTGLGLSIAYTIIESHKGTIVVDSEEGVGTTFTITIPIT